MREQSIEPGPILAAGQTLRFDEDGFLIHPGLWNEGMAREIAEREGIDALSDGHWRVIRRVRDKYLSLGAVFSLRQACRGSGISQAEIGRLFGGCRAVWRIAGLPNPGEEARSYML